MPETCRVSWQNIILDTWCILLVIYTKIITMHGHLNIKYTHTHIHTHTHTHTQEMAHYWGFWNFWALRRTWESYRKMENLYWMRNVVSLNLGSVFTILEYYAAWVGNWLTTFRKKVSEYVAKRGRQPEISREFRFLRLWLWLKLSANFYHTLRLHATERVHNSQNILLLCSMLHFCSCCEPCQALNSV